MVGWDGGGECEWGREDGLWERGSGKELTFGNEVFEATY